MRNIKFVLIGGGSYSWTPGLITDIALTPALYGTHIVLQDISAEALATVVPLCQKISAAAGADLRVEGSTNLDAVLPGADFVGLTISCGGGPADDLDLSIPARHGIMQTVGDTVGPGGWSRALRNIPVVTDIIRRVEVLAPDAWFMNYTNPMTVLTRVVNKVSRVRSVGICHELQGLLLHLAYYFGVDWQKDIAVSMAGINHLIWALKIDVCGRDGLALFGEYAADPDGFRRLGDKGMPEELEHSGGTAPTQKIKLDLLQRCGYLPIAGDAHTAEFFPQYLQSPEAAASWGFTGGQRAHTFARSSSRAARRQRCLDLLEGREPLYLKHSHEHADRTIAALSGLGDPLLTPLNLPNCGQIDNLPREAVVETLAYADAGGVHPLAVGALPAILSQYLIRHISNQEMIVEAGLSGDRDLAVEALAGDPAVPDRDVAARLADEFMTEFREWLPQFHGKWSL